MSRGKVNDMRMHANVQRLVATVTVLIAISALLFSCRRGPMDPWLGDDTKPGKRDYLWAIDTLAYPGSFQTLMMDIWGSSPLNVYVVGHNDQPGPGTMFRYDGKQWSTTHFHRWDGGTVGGAVDLSDVEGFGPNDIYVVGERVYDNPTPPPSFLDSSLVLHFDGIRWREIAIERDRFLTDIAGLSPNNLWTVGWHGTVFHYDGVSWNRERVSVPTPPRGFFQLNSVAVTSDLQVYALGVTSQYSPPKETYYFFRRESTGWKVLDTAVLQYQGEYKWGYSKLWMSPWGKLYSVGVGVFVWNGSSWTKLLETGDWMSSIFGTSERNIFVVGQFGAVYHYNGSDWYRYVSFAPKNISLTTEWLFSVWTDGNEVFVVGHDTQARQTIILHGR